MITTDLFESRDICRVCGQTPCNCTHVNEEKVRLDPKCWKGKKIGNPKTKMKGGVRVNNCVPAESVAEMRNTDDPMDDMIEDYLDYLESVGMLDKSREEEKAQLIAGLESGALHSSEIEYALSGTKWDPLASKGMAEDHDNGEYSDEAGMAHGNLITIAKAARGLLDTIDQHEDLPEWVQEKIAKVEGMLVSAWNYLQSQEAQGIDPRITEVYGTLAEAWSHVRNRMELVEEFDIIERVVEGLAVHNGVDQEVIWEDLESLTDDELYVFAVTTPIMEDWQKVNKRDKTDGMSRKAVKAYRREHPGSKLKTAVTTKPSKLKKGSKASKRRKSYCSRSRGQMKMHNISCAKTPDKAICKARRRWNCESVDNSGAMVAEASIPYALSAANANAEHRRQGAAGGGYRGRIDIPVQSREDYISAGRALKKAATSAGEKIEYGLSNGVMSVFSDSMDSDALDQFIDGVLGQGVAEAKADPTSTWVVYDGDRVKRFKTHQGAKAYAEQHGGKVASSAHYADKIQGKQGMAEMDKSQPSHGRDGKISHSTYGSRDKGGSQGQDRTAQAVTAKQATTDAERIMNKAHDEMMKSMSTADKVKKGWRNPNIDEGYDTEELANEVYAEFERIYPNLARRADERTVHAAIVDVLNYGGDNNAGALAQDVARAVKQQMQQGVAEGDYNIRRDPTYQKYDPETHTMMYKDGKHKLIKHDQVAKARALGWKVRSSLKAFAKGQGGVAEADQLQGTPVVSLKDLGDEDNKKNKYGQTVPKKLKKDDPRVKFHKDQKQDVAEVSDETLTSYLSKVDADSQKHDKDPTKRSAEKRNKSVQGFARAFNKLDARKEKVDEISKEKLADYLHAAHQDVVDRASSASFQSGKAGDKYNRADVSDKERQRQAGMTRAVSRLTRENSMADELARMAMRRNPNALVRKDGEVMQEPAKPEPPKQPDPVALAQAWAKRYPNINADVEAAKAKLDPNYEYAEGPAYYAGKAAEENYRHLLAIKNVIDAGLKEQSGLGFGE